MLSIVIEIAILAAVVFEAVISWKHYQLSRRQALEIPEEKFKVCRRCAFPLATRGVCPVCESMGH